jgi:hypothetical protein
MDNKDLTPPEKHIAKQGMEQAITTVTKLAKTDKLSEQGYYVLCHFSALVRAIKEELEEDD